jgi:hypothetical protein
MITALLALCAVTVTAHAAPTPTQLCESAKDAAEATFSKCRLTADSKYAKSPDAGKRAAAYAKCDSNLATAYARAEVKYGVACPTTMDVSPVDGFLAACTAKARDWTGDALASPLVFERFPVSGQTTCWIDGSNSSPPIGVVCSAATGTGGQDGAAAAGATLAYVDNGDGTVTDSNTGLEWEKKSDDGGLHDKDNFYSWVGYCTFDNTSWCTRDADCSAFVPGATCDASPTGAPLTIFQWVDQVNAANFAGHNDWRIPNVRELASLANYGNVNPAVSAEFNSNCGANSSGNPGCTVTTCSCTGSFLYWSSSTYASTPQTAWVVNFYDGLTTADGKFFTDYARAVRGGS